LYGKQSMLAFSALKRKWQGFEAPPLPYSATLQACPDHSTNAICRMVMMKKLQNSHV
jgi:hypothetical protein